MCIPKEPRRTKKYTHTHTNIIDLTPPGGQVSAGPPLVSQWTLLQPRWRMAQSDLSPATNTDDGMGERKGKKKKGGGTFRRQTRTDSQPLIHTTKTVLSGSCYSEHCLKKLKAISPQISFIQPMFQVTTYPLKRNPKSRGFVWLLNSNFNQNG